MRKLFLFALLCLFTTASNAQFSGYFAPHNWTETSSGASATASVDTTQAHDSLFFYGPNDDSGLEGNLTYSIEMPGTGTLSFGFEVTSNDTSGVSDPYEYFVWTHNSDTLSIIKDTTSGITNFAVDSGAIFTFTVNTSLNSGGNIQAKIFDWEFSSTALPVTGSPITALAQNGKVELSWNTFTETNNTGFEIQRSADGKNFTPIGFVPSKASNGNSTDKQYYDFSDLNIQPGLIYYRYKQIDYDGKFAYSNVAGVNTDGSTTAKFEAYPNPTKGNIHVSISEPGILKVVDITGKTVKELSMNASGLIDLSDIVAGIYSLDFTGSTTQFKMKISKL